MKVTEVRIKKECRELHGGKTAYEKACDYLFEKYKHLLSAECNEDKTVIIELHIDK